jgi:hypothetical protein
MSSHNRNPKGVNQYAPVRKFGHFYFCVIYINEVLATAQDPALKAALETYHRQGLTSNKRISELLKADHNIVIKSVFYYLLLPHILSDPFARYFVF